MNYQEAAKIRKTGLLSLIAEKKFEEGQGLGSSIGGAISEKFKAKGMGFKEKLDPLNMLSKMVGKGVLGKSITTIAGRAFGRDEDTIRYFGGYSKKKQVKKKDPLLSTVGPGVVTNVKVGDSVTDVMAKMYNFMEKTYEVKKRNDELEQAFRKEQLDEDERRHQKIIDAIFGRKVKPEEPKEEDKSWLEKMMSGLKDALAPIMGILSSLVSAIGPLLSSLGGLITSLAGPLLNILMKPIKLMIQGMFKSFVYEIVGKLGARSAVALLGGTLSTILLGGLAAIGVGAGVVNYNEYMTGIKEGPDAQRIDKEIGQIENEYASIQNPADPRLQEMNQRIEEKQKERKIAAENYVNEKLIPLMEEDGWKKEKNQDGEIIFKKDGKIADDLDIAEVINSNEIKDSLQKAIKDNLEIKKIQKPIDDAIEKVKEILPIKDNKSLTPAADIIPSNDKTIPKEVPIGGGEEGKPFEVIVNGANDVKNIPGAPPKLMNTSSTKIRNEDLIPYNRNISVAV